MDDKIKIKKTTKCDTRTLPKGAVVSKSDAYADTILHREAVKACGQFLVNKLVNQFSKHDWSKLGEFLPEFTDGLNKGFDSEEFTKWYDKHVTSERHHLLKNVPEDVNLIDVLEMLCDCVSAGMARTGKVFDVEVPADVLTKAVANTVKMLIDNIEVED